LEPILRVENLARSFMMGDQEVRAVDGIDLEAAPGDFISFMGPSGSGKTTLLNLVGCIDRPTSGRVVISGRDTSAMPDRELDLLRLNGIGFVFQKINLIPILTAFENIELPMEIAGAPPAQRRERVKELLDAVEMSHRADHKPGQLSAGEQQRIGIARALVNHPDVVLADEPTGNLDTRTASSIMNFLTRLNGEFGQTLILVTHDPEVGAAARRRFVMRDGRIDSREDG